MGEKVSCEIDDGIAWITMDDGKVNAMSTDMMREIGTALDTADEAQAVAVLRGREGIFSAGFDMPTIRRGPKARTEMVRTGAELILKFLRHPLPILTVCTGHAFPMGAFLMLSSDARLGGEGPWKIGMNEVAIGLAVPMFAVELARHRLTSPGFANINAAAMFGPEGAARVGYLDKVISPERLEDAVKDEAQRLRALDTPSFTGTKARINAEAISAIAAALETGPGEITGAAA